VITLVLGGTRSGKSEAAERIAGRLPPPVIYIATMDPGTDPDLAARIEAHRARRPGDWQAIEAGAGSPGDLPAILRSTAGSVLLDGLGPWVAASPGMAVDARALCDGLTGRAGSTVVVSDEVGLGVHPASERGRRFRDALGTLNQAVAVMADEVLLVVAGRLLRLDPPEGP
jgi:adenosyl cobinamide kinase/adenosyl cobinamide phosphate guanylyltransferase